MKPLVIPKLVIERVSRSNDQLVEVYDGPAVEHSDSPQTVTDLRFVTVHQCSSTGPMACVCFYVFGSPPPFPELREMRSGKLSNRGSCVVLISYLSIFALFFCHHPLPACSSDTQTSHSPPLCHSIVSLGLEYRTQVRG